MMYSTKHVFIDGVKVRVPKHMYEPPVKIKAEKKKRSRKSYRGMKWLNLRGWFLVDRDYMCEICNNYANHVHHKKPVKYFPELLLDRDNLIVLCGECHRKQHMELPHNMFLQK